MDLSRVLLFATDAKTKNLAQNTLGLTTFYNPVIFSSIPTGGGSSNNMGKFGDKNFGRIMLAKVYCVHLVNDLGYDVLFQDVDVIPLRPDVLDYFDTINIKNNKEFDLYFQYEHDFSRRQAPFCANSGFYFIKSNKKNDHR